MTFQIELEKMKPSRPYMTNQVSFLINDYGFLNRFFQDSIMDPKQYVGRAPEQVENFIKNEVKPAISNFELGNGKAELTV